MYSSFFPNQDGVRLKRINSKKMANIKMTLKEFEDAFKKLESLKQPLADLNQDNSKSMKVQQNLK